MIKRLTSEDYTVSRWAGGTTTQLAICPPNADYASRDFLWRVSSAMVELEESDFTALPDYDRYISVLAGEMCLRHGSEEELSLSPGQVHFFDGGAETKSKGRCTDFNLMLRKGACQGDLADLTLTSGEQKSWQETTGTALLLYCALGSGTIVASGEQISLTAGESVLLQPSSEQEITLTAAADSRFMAARMGQPGQCNLDERAC